MKKIKFIPKYVTPIIEGEKYCTVRYGWEEDEIPQQGERILLGNSHNGISFAEATCTFAEEMTIEEFVGEKWSGHIEYKSVKDMIWALNHFYNENMNAQTKIDVIGWRSVQSLYK